MENGNKKPEALCLPPACRLIWFIPPSTRTRGRQSKIKAPPKVKAAVGIILCHAILLQI
jgi:hypothetical protein